MWLIPSPPDDRPNPLARDVDPDGISWPVRTVPTVYIQNGCVASDSPVLPWWMASGQLAKVEPCDPALFDRLVAKLKDAIRFVHCSSVTTTPPPSGWYGYGMGRIVVGHAGSVTDWSVVGGAWDAAQGRNHEALVNVSPLPGVTEEQTAYGLVHEWGHLFGKLGHTHPDQSPSYMGGVPGRCDWTPRQVEYVLGFIEPSIRSKQVCTSYYVWCGRWPSAAELLKRVRLSKGVVEQDRDIALSIESIPYESNIQTFPTRLYKRLLDRTLSQEELTATRNYLAYHTPAQLYDSVAASPEALEKRVVYE